MSKQRLYPIMKWLRTHIRILEHEIWKKPLGLLWIADVVQPPYCKMNNLIKVKEWGGKEMMAVLDEIKHYTPNKCRKLTTREMVPRN